MARKTTRSVGDIASSYFGDVGERYKIGGVDLLGLPTSFETVDLYTGGMQPDQFWIVGAVTSSGKTSLGTSMAFETARHGKGTILFSLEMSGEILVNRILSGMTLIPSGRIIRGRLSEQEYKQIAQAVEELHETNLIIVDKTVSSAELVEDSLKIADSASFDIGNVIVDYAGILKDPSTSNEVQRLADISKNLKSLSRPDYLDTTVLSFVQLNRQAYMREDQRPVISDIQGSSAFGQDADVVLLLYRPHLSKLTQGVAPQEVERDAEIIIAKNRNGPTGSTAANFYPKLMRWEQKRPDAVQPRSLGES